MDIAIGGCPILVIVSEGSFKNFYAFALDDNKIKLVDKIEDLQDGATVDLKYFEGHYFVYGQCGIISRVSLSKN